MLLKRVYDNKVCRRVDIGYGALSQLDGLVGKRPSFFKGHFNYTPIMRRYIDRFTDVCKQLIGLTNAQTLGVK